jgi:hypothetical protein
MAARRNLQSLSNLVSAITRLSHTNSDGNSEEAEDTDVKATIRSLFPSTNGRAGQSKSAQDSVNSQSLAVLMFLNKKYPIALQIAVSVIVSNDLWLIETNDQSQ